MNPPEQKTALVSEQKSLDAVTEVRFEHSRNFPAILSQLGVSVLVSTYQAGKVLVLGTHEGQLSVAFHQLEQPMGIAVSPKRLAIGTRREIWFFAPAADLAARIEPAGKFDGAFLARSAHHTGTIAGRGIA